MSQAAGDLVYERCLAQHGSALTEEIARCLVAHRMADRLLVQTEAAMEDDVVDPVSSFDYSRSVLLVLSSSLVFVMQAGFAMLCAGRSSSERIAMVLIPCLPANSLFCFGSSIFFVSTGVVRRENVANTMLKNLMDACGSAVAFFAVGWAFAFGGMDSASPEKTFCGTDNFFLRGVDDLAFWLFQYAFSAAAATIVAGTLAERYRMAGYLCFTVMLTGWVYPIVVHAVWNHQGFLSAYSVEPLWGSGMVDFAGSGVIQ